MLTEREILDHLYNEGAVLTDSHFVYTNGGHGTGYANMRAVAHQTSWLMEVADGFADLLAQADFDYIIGPETLGRTLATMTGEALGGSEAIWCDMTGEGSDKRAVFSKKMNFRRLVPGSRFVIVDDLLTTGSSIRLVADLIRDYDGEPVMGMAVVRRTPDVSAEDCGVPELQVLADIPGFVVFSSKECAESGPCSRQVPVVLRPGHGEEWARDHPGYPTV